MVREMIAASFLNDLSRTRSQATDYFEGYFKSFEMLVHCFLNFFCYSTFLIEFNHETSP